MNRLVSLNRNKNIKIIYPNYLENYDIRKVQPLGINMYNHIINNNNNNNTIVHCMSGGCIH